MTRFDLEICAITIFLIFKGGECDLQDQSMAFGSDRSRLNVAFDEKRSKAFVKLVKN